MPTDRNPARTAAVLAALSVRPEAPKLVAYTTSAATWLEGIEHRAPYLPLPATWSAKRGAYWVGVGAEIPEITAVPASSPAPKPRARRAGDEIPAGWSVGAWEHYQANRRATSYEAMSLERINTAAMRACEKREGAPGMAPSTWIRFRAIDPEASPERREKLEKLQAKRMARAVKMGLSFDVEPAPAPVAAVEPEPDIRAAA